VEERRLTAVIALVISLALFAVDWSGFNKWDPNIFFPKPFRHVWWHFPILLLLTWFAVTLFRSISNKRR
jgi:hypothetical protein